jgi:hypothetical protein
MTKKYGFSVKMDVDVALTYLKRAVQHPSTFPEDPLIRFKMHLVTCLTATWEGGGGGGKCVLANIGEIPIEAHSVMYSSLVWWQFEGWCVLANIGEIHVTNVVLKFGAKGLKNKGS